MTKQTQEELPTYIIAFASAIMLMFIIGFVYYSIQTQRLLSENEMLKGRIPNEDLMVEQLNIYSKTNCNDGGLFFVYREDFTWSKSNWYVFARKCIKEGYCKSDYIAIEDCKVIK